MSRGSSNRDLRILGQSRRSYISRGDLVLVHPDVTSPADLSSTGLRHSHIKEGDSEASVSSPLRFALSGKPTACFITPRHIILVTTFSHHYTHALSPHQHMMLHSVAPVPGQHNYRTSGTAECLRDALFDRWHGCDVPRTTHHIQLSASSINISTSISIHSINSMSFFMGRDDR
ncbi:uncharacterized protein YALI1_F16165g [Yarrowia lipolytica]|uniref:Uncharacterized protein n=1 Tax=Yarrowia lipolytica TaxID=4952 RepID=A0A1D8NN21_YARLL|nr:hypothetical protein YALI1_F16165g [Yarrowia lipolytica]